MTITAMSRPELFRDMALSLTDNPLDGWRILVAIEPGPCAAEIAEICQQIFRGHDCSVTINPEVFGIRKNPFELIKRAMEGGSRLNLHVEEDMLLAPDALSLARWYERHHRPEWLCLNLIAGPCGCAGMLSDSRLPRALVQSRTFNSIGFAIRREEWQQHVAAAWDPDAQPPPVPGGLDANWRTQGGWDWSIYGLLAATPGLYSVQPVLARATHTGRVGTHARPEFHDAAFAHIAINHEPQGDFVLVSADSLPSPVRALVNLHNEITDMRMMLEKASRAAGEAAQTAELNAGRLRALEERYSLRRMLSRLFNRG